MSDTDMIQETDVSDSESNDDEDQPVKVYGVRWAVLVIASITISLRGYNQSCFGIINNVYAKYFSVLPWQIDWFVVVQSVVFFSASLPLTVVTKRLNFKVTICLITGTLVLGFTISACGILSRNMGYELVLLGQGIMGFSNILSWSIAPATAAIWFPPSQVAMAVAAQVVARGVGEAIGCILPPLLVDDKSSLQQVEMNLLWMFVTLGSLAFLLFVVCVTLLKSKPRSPPSDAQAAAIRVARRTQTHDFRSSIAEFWATVKTLFRSKTFVFVWVVFGAVNPILRNSNILLSSMLRKHFDRQRDIDWQVGVVLLIAWSMYTVGGFIAGPLISYTRRYKEMVLVNVVFLFITCLMLFVGIYTSNLITVYIAVSAQGLFLGMANTSLFELLIEVTYPQQAMFVTMIAIVVMGLFRLLYPIIGRMILKFAGATAATTFPIATMFLCSLILFALKPEYKRELANSSSESRILLRSNKREKSND